MSYAETSGHVPPTSTLPPFGSSFSAEEITGYPYYVTPKTPEDEPDTISSSCISSSSSLVLSREQVRSLSHLPFPSPNVSFSGFPTAPNSLVLYDPPADPPPLPSISIPPFQVDKRIEDLFNTMVLSTMELTIEYLKNSKQDLSALVAAHYEDLKGVMHQTLFNDTQHRIALLERQVKEAYEVQSN